MLGSAGHQLLTSGGIASFSEAVFYLYRGGVVTLTWQGCGSSSCSIKAKCRRCSADSDGRCVIGLHVAGRSRRTEWEERAEGGAAAGHVSKRSFPGPWGKDSLCKHATFPPGRGSPAALDKPAQAPCTPLGLGLPVRRCGSRDKAVLSIRSGLGGDLQLSASLQRQRLGCSQPG